MQRPFRGRTAAILPLFLYAGASVLFWRNILPRALGNVVDNRFDNPTDLLYHIPLRESQPRNPELFEFALPFSIALERILGSPLSPPTRPYLRLASASMRRARTRSGP